LERRPGSVFYPRNLVKNDFPRELTVVDASDRPERKIALEPDIDHRTEGWRSVVRVGTVITMPDNSSVKTKQAR
jgi:hypothetical protein